MPEQLSVKDCAELIGHCWQELKAGALRRCRHCGADSKQAWTKPRK